MTARATADKSAPARRRRGFRHAASIARPHLGAAAASCGFAEPDILIRWREIVGDALFDLCQPVRVDYRKDGSLGGTLLVCAEGPAALQIEHSASAVIERINSYYGYRAIARLKVTQSTGAAGQPRGFAEAAAGFRGKPGPAGPSAQALETARDLTRDIRCDELRAALTRMGAHILDRPTGSSG